jgi:site-specific recombinase XerD
MYLLDMAMSVTVRRDDGGTLKHISSDLTHIIKFCWKNSLVFGVLVDADFRSFVSGLLPDSDLSVKRMRNTNTVRRIIMRTLHFFAWIQNNFLLDRPLVGLSKQSAQITLCEKPSDYLRNTSRLVYRYLPPKDITDPKKPMPTAIRNQLTTAVHRLHQRNVERSQLLVQVSDISQLRVDLLLQRRQLLLRLLEATGCRPGELTELSVTKNRLKIQEMRLILPTLKRRKARAVERIIPIDDGTAIKFAAFLGLRERFFAALQRSDRQIQGNDHVFVSITNGLPLRISSLESEFKRIRTEARTLKDALPSQRACMSMFRHRFITKMVAIYLTEFLKENPLVNRFTITESDYRTILTRVKVLTGHGSVESLFPYIHLAWEELGIFDGADSAAQAFRAIEAARADVEDIQLNLKCDSTANLSTALGQAIESLEATQKRISQALSRHQGQH